ncbi:MAG: dihydropteroate synthase [Pseudomonadota bacterium]
MIDSSTPGALAFAHGPVAVMGVLNVTPDSFSDGGAFLSVDAACRHAEAMVEDGAAIVDIGGESTRPGATPVDESEELDRVIPVIEALASRVPVMISVDTSKAAVMRAAVAAGASMINDVWALRQPGAIEAAAAARVPVCLMHMQGEPGTMQRAPQYDNAVADVAEFLSGRIAACEAAGIERELLVVDPGFGFGKRLHDNVQLLTGLAQISALGVPVLAGLSRKSMLGELTGASTGNRLIGSVILAAEAVRRGAHIVRVHDVAQTTEALTVLSAVLASEQ